MLEGAGRNFFEGAMRSGAAALRGYFEAKVNVARAKTQAELQRANSRLAQARNDLLRQQNEIQQGLGQAQIESNERIAQMQDAGQTQRVELDIDGKRYMAELDDKGQTTRTWIQSQAAENVAETGAQAQVDTANIGAQAGTEQAKIGAESAKNVAQIGADAQKAVAQTGAQASGVAAQIDYDKALQVAEMETEALKDVANVKAQAEVDKAFYEKMGAGGVSTDASRHFMSVRSAAKQSDAYKLLHATQTAVQRAFALYKDGGTPADDIALMNIFQRTIDPGVSVREGDVQLQQSTMPYIAQIEATLQRVNEGVVLTPPMRQELLRTLVELANSDYDILLPRLEQTIGSDITMNAELAAAGYNASNLFYIAPQRFDGAVVSDPETGAVTIGAETTTGADGRMEKQPAQEPTGTGAESKIVKLVEWAKLRMSEGKPGTEVREALVSRLTQTISDPAQRQAILDGVDSQVQWETEPERAPGASRQMNKRRQ